MNKEQLFEVFKELFPDWAKKTTSYMKIGSRTLAIKFEMSVDDQKATEVSRVFLYINPNNWQFGTKLYRKRPEKNKKLSFDATERTETMGR